MKSVDEMVHDPSSPQPIRTRRLVPHEQIPPVTGTSELSDDEAQAIVGGNDTPTPA